MKRTLALVREFRAGDDATPIVLMGYYNPIYVYGVERFLADAKSAGVDGLIVVDLPPEEDAELCLPALKAGFNFIRLATPTTDDKRLPAVLTNTSGFVYYVSITGITGSAAPDTGKVAAAVNAHQAAHQAAGLRRLRRAHRRAGPCALRKAPTASWSARLWSRRSARVSAPTARPTPATVPAVSGPGPRAGRRRSRQAGVKAAAAD